MSAPQTNPQTAPQPVSSGLDLAEIKALILSFAADCHGMNQSTQALNYVNNADLLNWLKASRKSTKPITRPRICIFGGHHGASSVDERAQAEKQFQDILANKTPLSDMVAEINADLKLYELDFLTPTNATPPAMTEAECVRAIAYGMMAIEQGTDLIGLTAIGAGSDAASHKIITAIEQGTDSFDALMMFGGFEHAAMIGAILATKLGGVPVVMEGEAARACYTLLKFLNGNSVNHTTIEETEIESNLKLISKISCLKILSYIR